MGNVCSTTQETATEQAETPKVLLEKTYKGVTFENARGDICEEEVDALLNAANYQLSHKTGIANSFVNKGGPLIQEESDKIVEEHEEGLELGTAHVTSAGNLKAKHIIHVVCPVWMGGANDEEIKLGECVINALKKADELKLTKLAVPSLSSGAFGFPRDICARILVSKCMEYFDKNENSSVKLIKFVNTDTPTVNALGRALTSLIQDEGQVGEISTEKERTF
mgnify:CR=1 FL=1